MIIKKQVSDGRFRFSVFSKKYTLPPMATDAVQDSQSSDERRPLLPKLAPHRMADQAGVIEMTNLAPQQPPARESALPVALHHWVTSKDETQLQLAGINMTLFGEVVARWQASLPADKQALRPRIKLETSRHGATITIKVDKEVMCLYEKTTQKNGAKITQKEGLFAKEKGRYVFVDGEVHLTREESFTTKRGTFSYTDRGQEFLAQGAITHKNKDNILIEDMRGDFLEELPQRLASGIHVVYTLSASGQIRGTTTINQISPGESLTYRQCGDGPRELIKWIRPGGEDAGTFVQTDDSQYLVDGTRTYTTETGYNIQMVGKFEFQADYGDSVLASGTFCKAIAGRDADEAVDIANGDYKYVPEIKDFILQKGVRTRGDITEDGTFDWIAGEVRLVDGLATIKQDQKSVTYCGQFEYQPLLKTMVLINGRIGSATPSTHPTTKKNTYCGQFEYQPTLKTMVLINGRLEKTALSTHPTILVGRFAFIPQLGRMALVDGETATAQLVHSGRFEFNPILGQIVCMQGSRIDGLQNGQMIHGGTEQRGTFVFYPQAQKMGIASGTRTCYFFDAQGTPEIVTEKGDFKLHPCGEPVLFRDGEFDPQSVTTALRLLGTLHAQPPRKAVQQVG